MEKRYLKLNDIDCYKTAFSLSNIVWNIVSGWEYFARDTVGKQFVRSIDSISANIAEGFGRYSKKDKIRFYRISMGSLKESLDWNKKARQRNLINNEVYNNVYSLLQSLPKQINQLINYTNDKLLI